MIKRISSLAFGLAVLLASDISSAAVPTAAMTFDTNIYVSNATSSQEAKIQKAEEKIRDVIGSEAFRTKVLNFTYAGKKQFKDNGGLTNAQIYQKILDASEKVTPGKDNEMDLKIKTYYENSSTVGFTSTSSLYINMNTKFLNKYTANNVTRNMIHEWLHKLGFHHAVNYSTSRDYSVPYAIGSIMEKLAAQY
jgi:hypothetical protein